MSDVWRGKPLWGHPHQAFVVCLVVGSVISAWVSGIDDAGPIFIGIALGYWVRGWWNG